MRVANLSVSCTRRMEDVAHHALAQLLLPLHPAGRAALHARLAHVPPARGIQPLPWRARPLTAARI